MLSHVIALVRTLLGQPRGFTPDHYTPDMSSQHTASEASPSMNQLLEELSEIDRRNLDGEVSDLSRKSKGRGSYGAVYTGKYKGVCGLLCFHVQVVR